MSATETMQSPRDALAQVPDAYLANGLAAFREKLSALRGILQILKDLDKVQWTEQRFYLSADTTGSTAPVR